MQSDLTSVQHWELYTLYTIKYTIKKFVVCIFLAC